MFYRHFTGAVHHAAPACSPRSVRLSSKIYGYISCVGYYLDEVCSVPLAYSSGIAIAVGAYAQISIIDIHIERVHVFSQRRLHINIAIIHRDVRLP